MKLRIILCFRNSNTDEIEFIDKLILSDYIDMADRHSKEDTTETNSSTMTPILKAKTDASMYFNPLEPAKDPISKNGWNSKSADQILLLLERNTNTILDVSDQHIDDEGLELIHFFFTFNKRLRKLISGFNLLGNKFTNEGFWKFYTAMDILYDKFELKPIKTYCGKYVQKNVCKARRRYDTY